MATYYQAIHNTVYPTTTNNSDNDSSPFNHAFYIDQAINSGSLFFSLVNVVSLVVICGSFILFLISLLIDHSAWLISCACSLAMSIYSLTATPKSMAMDIYDNNAAFSTAASMHDDEDDEDVNEGDRWICLLFVS